MVYQASRNAGRKSFARQLQRRRCSRTYRPLVERLEVRNLLATLTVTTEADNLSPDDGTVSLREAITVLNAQNNLGYSDITVIGHVPTNDGAG